MSSSDRWNNAWGVVAYAQAVAPQTIGGTTVDVTGLTVTFTAVAGRRYLTTAYLIPSSTVNGDDFSASITSETNNTAQIGATPILESGVSTTLQLSVVETGLSGSITRKVRALRAAGTGTVTLAGNAAYPMYISVEDVGPVAGAVAIPNPTPAWIPVTFQNGWSNYGAPFQTVGCRIVGDVVSIRGLMKGGTIDGTSPAFTLPSGYYPPGRLQFSTQANGAFAWFGVTEAGLVIAAAGSNLAFNVNCSFSVTP